MVETFGEQSSTNCDSINLGGRIGRRVVKKHRVEWTDLQDPFEINCESDHISSEIKSNLCAQKQPNFVAPAPLASDAAEFSVAVSHANYVRELYLSDPEVSGASDSFQVSA
jgi:hypothetical protein